jgi:hypothetical protein
VEKGESRVDTATVKGIELLAPGVWQKDKTVFLDRISQPTIFSKFSEKERATIQENFLKIRCLIPSLYSFFQDVQYLQLCADSLRHLVPPLRGETIFQALYRSLEGDDEERKEIYVRLQCFAMQHYCRMAASPKSKNVNAIARPSANPDALASLESRFKSGPMRNESTDDFTLGDDLKRCGLPSQKTYERIWKFLVFEKLTQDYEKCQTVDEFNFFIHQSRFKAFFGRYLSTESERSKERDAENRRKEGVSSDVHEKSRLALGEVDIEAAGTQMKLAENARIENQRLEREEGRIYLKRLVGRSIRHLSDGDPDTTDMGFVEAQSNEEAKSKIEKLVDPLKGKILDRQMLIIGWDELYDTAKASGNILYVLLPGNPYRAFESTVALVESVPKWEMPSSERHAVIARLNLKIQKGPLTSANRSKESVGAIDLNARASWDH